jgi:Protein of unknown function (DUF2950)
MQRPAGDVVKEDTMMKLSGSFLITLVVVAASMASAATAEVRQQRFQSPDVALEALVAADRAHSQPQLLAVLGAQGAPLIRSGDPIADRSGEDRFVAAYDDAHRIDLEGQNKAVVIVGKEEWPLPIPLIRETGGWRFDTDAGKEEILNRRIGHNELKVIEVCREYVQAQREYAAMKMGGEGEYARQFKSNPGRHDGLYWPVKPGDPESPFGPLVAEARAIGYVPRSDSASRAASHPFHGYYFRILTAQGAHAAGGASSYLVDGHMKRGFALIAYPATYGDSGIMTFVVNQTGIVFEKNFGPQTSTVARQITEYDPDSSWRAP